MTRGPFSLSTGTVDPATIAGRCEDSAPEWVDVDAFLVGQENAVVRVLAAAVAQPTLPYNPIVICGPAGIGKSTVARALLARRQVALGLTNVVTTTGLDLARSLAHAVEIHATDEFRAHHHRCDALLVDDGQGLCTRPAAQQFLQCAMDALLQRGSLVIVTLPQSPLAIRKLASPLASRLTAGLVVTLAHPGFAARCELVRRESCRVSLDLPAFEIEELAGQDCPSKPLRTASQLRAAVLQRAAGGSHRAVSESRAPNNVRPPVVDEKRLCRQACHVVARHFGLAAGDLRAKSRSKSIAEARAIAMYVARELTGASFGKLGKQFGGRDHSTVLHACKKLAEARLHDPQLRQLLEELLRQTGSLPDRGAS